jgi:hypothetical protein
LNDAILKALEDPVTSKRLLDKGCILPDRAERSPQALQERVESEVARWSSILKGAKAVRNRPNASLSWLSFDAVPTFQCRGQALSCISKAQLQGRRPVPRGYVPGSTSRGWSY